MTGEHWSAHISVTAGEAAELDELAKVAGVYDGRALLRRVAGDDCSIQQLARMHRPTIRDLVERARTQYGVAAGEVCDECDETIPGSERDMVNAHHAESCSLHPGNTV